MIALITSGIAIGAARRSSFAFRKRGPLATGFWRLALAVLPLLPHDGAQSVMRESDAAPSRLQSSACGSHCPAFSLPPISARMAPVAPFHICRQCDPAWQQIWRPFSSPSVHGFCSRSRVSSSFIVGLVVAVAGVIVLKGRPRRIATQPLVRRRHGASRRRFLRGLHPLGRPFAQPLFHHAHHVVGAAPSRPYFSLPVAYFMEGHILPATLYGWLVLAGLAWLTHAAGQSMIAYALAFPASLPSSLTLLLQPVVAAFLSPGPSCRSRSG